MEKAGAGIYFLLAIATGLVAIVGYAGYLLYPRFDLPSAIGIGASLLVLAAAGA